MAGKNVNVAPRIGGLSAAINGSSSVKDFETMLQLIYLYATSPRKDAALFNGWKEKQKSAVQYSLQDPQTSFIDTFIKHYFKRMH